MAEAKLTWKQKRAHLIERARELYGTDDIEIDEGAALSPTDDGCWVAAWVYVPEEN